MHTKNTSQNGKCKDCRLQMLLHFPLNEKPKPFRELQAGEAPELARAAIKWLGTDGESRITGLHWIALC